LNGLDLEIVKGDIQDKDFLSNAFSDCSYLIHTAAQTSIWPRRSALVREVNFQGTKNLMEIAEAGGIYRMVHIGTANSFHPGSKDEPGNEESEFRGWKYQLDYMESKYLAQEMLLERYQENNFPVVIINPTYMIGPYDTGPSSGRMLLELYADRLPGYSVGGRNFIYSKDVAVAAVNALEQGRTGQCYIAGTENLSYEEFFQKACAVRGKEFNLRRVPYFLVLIGGFFNSLISRLIGKPPQLSYTMARMSGVDHYFSSEKAQREINLPQTPLEVGINECLTWFEDNGYFS
jgi:dihydroflavonol-4-reductase